MWNNAARGSAPSSSGHLFLRQTIAAICLLAEVVMVCILLLHPQKFLSRSLLGINPATQNILVAFMLLAMKGLGCFEMT